MQYYRIPPKLPAYIQIFEHKVEDGCERLINGTTQFFLVDGINCITRLTEPYVMTRNAMGSLTSIQLQTYPQQMVQVGTIPPPPPSPEIPAGSLSSTTA